MTTYTKRLKEGVKKSTINRDLSCIRTMFNKAIDWEYMTENPAKKVRQFPEKDNIQERVLSRDEEGRLFKAYGADYPGENFTLVIAVRTKVKNRLQPILEKAP